jgi:hypothetical protein
MYQVDLIHIVCFHKYTYGNMCQIELQMYETTDSGNALIFM